MSVTNEIKDTKDKSFCFVCYVNWSRMRNGDFRILYRLVRELNDLIRESISEWIGLFCPLCFAGPDSIWMEGKEDREYSNSVRRYECKDCGNRFSERTLSPFYRRRYPEVVISAAVVLYYELERSPKEISRLIGIPEENELRSPCIKTIQEWILIYSFLLALGGRSIPLPMDGIWESDELYKRVRGKRAYTLGMESRESKIIHLMDSWGASSKDLEESFILAHSRFGSKPEMYQSDEWHGYQKVLSGMGIEHGTVCHSKEYVSKEGYHDNNMERLWSTYRSWLRKARGYKRMDNSEIFTAGFESYYIFLRPHMSLDNRTPAKSSGLEFDSSWHYLLTRGQFVIEPAWLKAENECPIPD